MIDELLNFENFKTWVVQQEGQVGVRGTPCNCPIATYLREKTGDIYFVTLFKYYKKDLSGNFNITPNWALSFINQIDNGSFSEAFLNPTPTVVYVQEALDVLNNVQQWGYVT